VARNLTQTIALRHVRNELAHEEYCSWSSTVASYSSTASAQREARCSMFASMKWSDRIAFVGRRDGVDTPITGQLYRLAKRRPELARWHDRILRSRRSDDERELSFVDHERVEDPSTLDRYVLEDVELDRRLVEDDRGPAGLSRVSGAELALGRVAKPEELRGHRVASTLTRQGIGQAGGVDHTLRGQEMTYAPRTVGDRSTP
jgi:hypothetical protein